MGVKKIVQDKLKSFSSAGYCPEKFLDVGRGEQVYSERLASDLYVGLDVKISGRKSDHELANCFCDGVRMPFASSTFDFILCTEVMEHLLSPDELMREMDRVLTSSGRLMITLPSMRGEHEVPCDFR